MATITIKDVVKSYASENHNREPILVLDRFTLNVAEGEFVTFFGPNGCGKTTLLKVIAGIEPFNSGTVLIDSMTPVEAKTGLVFQNFNDSLMPWLNGWDNVLFAYTLQKRKHQIDQARERLIKLLSDLGITLPLENYPYQMSGGQQQLMAILRTLIYQPDVILMDEPFSALDHKTRAFMQSTLLDIWQHEKPTILFVSHDIEEAIFLADRLVLLAPLPTTVTETKAIPFPRPRKRDVLESDDFFHLKRGCLHAVAM
jgi:NitT/TauT family transport system ATP-binding protein